MVDSQSRYRFERVSSQGASVLLKISYTKSVVSYILYMYRKRLRTEPDKTQHVAILNLPNEVILRKNIQNLVRCHKMKVFKSFNEKKEVAIGKGLALYMIPGRQCSCFAMFSVVYFLLKIQTLYCILTQGDQIYKTLRTD